LPGKLFRIIIQGYMKPTLKSFIFLFALSTVFLAPVHAADQQGVTRITIKLAKQIKAGMTRQEVGTLMGEPTKIKEGKDGSQIWIYERKEKRSTPPAPELPNPMPDIGRLEIIAKVKFNPEGIAVHVKQKFYETDRKSRLVTKEQFEQEMGS